MQRTVLICILLSLATLGIYAQSAGFEFVALDDDAYVTANAMIRGGLSADGIAWAFTNPHGGNWHPLTSLSHMLDVSLFGLSPGGPHVVNMLLHGLNVLLLFGLLRWTTGSEWTSAFAAALFAVHPLRVESVAWISERKDVLSMTFGLLALWSYADYALRGGARRYASTALALALGLMAKPMLVTLPFVFLLFDFWPLRRISPRRARDDAREAEDEAVAPGFGGLLFEKLPFFALAAISSVLTIVFQRDSGALGNADLVDFGGRAANAVVSYVLYLGKTIWPTDLSVLYPHPYLPGGSPWSTGAVAGAALALAAVTALVLAARRRTLVVGWLWFVGTLFPVIGLVQFGGQAMADRYTYLPSIGLCIMVAWLARDLAARVPRLQNAVVGACLAIVVALAATSHAQAARWKDSETLLVASLEAAPGSPVLLNNLGLVHFQKGRYETAIEKFRAAIVIRPDDAKAHNNLGAALRDSGKLDKAVTSFEEAVRLSPEYTEAQVNLGTAYKTKGETEKAIEHLRIAESLRPEDPAVRNNLGTALSAAGKHEEAIEVFEKLLEEYPEYARAHSNLGNALARKGDYEAAVGHYRGALALEPGYVLVHMNLASVLRALGRFDESTVHYRKFLESRPDEVMPMLQLSRILSSHPDPSRRDADEAIALATRAISISSATSTALDTLACGYAAAGRFDNAVELSGMAIDLARSSGANRAVADLAERRDGFLAGAPCSEPARVQENAAAR